MFHVWGHSFAQDIEVLLTLKNELVLTYTFLGYAGGRHGDRAASHASQSGEPGGAVRQKGEEQEGHDCGLSLEQLMHEDVGAKQALRSEDQQNKFGGGVIRRGL